MNRPLLSVCLRQAARIRRLTDELAEMTYGYQRELRRGNRMADALAKANRERDQAKADAELLFRLIPQCDRRAAVDMVRWRHEVETEEAS